MKEDPLRGIPTTTTGAAPNSDRSVRVGLNRMSAGAVVIF
jgi:hypothetical protein